MALKIALGNTSEDCNRRAMALAQDQHDVYHGHLANFTDPGSGWYSADVASVEWPHLIRCLRSAKEIALVHQLPGDYDHFDTWLTTRTLIDYYNNHDMPAATETDRRLTHMGWTSCFQSGWFADLSRLLHLDPIIDQHPTDDFWRLADLVDDQQQHNTNLILHFGWIGAQTNLVQRFASRLDRLLQGIHARGCRCLLIRTGPHEPHWQQLTAVLVQKPEFLLLYPSCFPDADEDWMDKLCEHASWRWRLLYG